MKTIEERAREYTKGQRYRLTAYKAYTAGASDQIAVDNDKMPLIRLADGYLHIHGLMK